MFCYFSHTLYAFCLCCVFIALKSHPFYNLLIFVRTQEHAQLRRSSSLKKVKKWSEMRYFNCSLLRTPMLYVLCLFTRPLEKRHAVQDLLSPLVRRMVFFHCWCLTWSTFPAGALQISYFEILSWRPKEMATGHKTHEVGRQSSNDHKCKVEFTLLHVLWYHSVVITKQ